MTTNPVDDELRELLEILTLVFRSLRKHGPELADVEPLKAAFFEAGLRERHEDEADRRRTIVSLPETVRGPAAKLAQARLEPLRRTLEQLSPTARRHFIQGLRILSREAASPEPGQTNRAE